MKTAVIFAALCVAYVAAHRGFMRNQEIADAVEKCKGSDSGPEFDDPNDSGCIAGCVGKELGVLNNGKVDTERMRELLNSGDHPHPERTERILADVEKCREESELSEDDCESARNYRQCMHRYKPRGGRHHRPDDE